jgi:hypothetical protein
MGAVVIVSFLCSTTMGGVMMMGSLELSPSTSVDGWIKHVGCFGRVRLEGFVSMCECQ